MEDKPKVRCSNCGSARVIVQKKSRILTVLGFVFITVIIHFLLKDLYGIWETIDKIVIVVGIILAIIGFIGGGGYTATCQDCGVVINCANDEELKKLTK